MNENQIIVHDWQDQILSDRAMPDVQTSSGNRDLGWGQGISAFVTGGTPATGIPYSEARAMTCATVWACSTARGETLGSLPSIVYQQQSELVRQRAKGSDPWRLLYEEPNPHMDAMTFYELMNMRQVNRGNAFAEIERDGADNPIALWPIHPSRVVPWMDNGQIVWDIMTDVKDPITGGYKMHRIADRNMLNICGPGGNGVLAPGVIDMGREEISSDIAAQQYGSSWFKSGARPSFVVEHPGYIDNDDQRNEFRADMNAIHAGRENWHKVAVLWNQSKLKEVQLSPEQAQLIPARDFNAKTVCRLYKVPPPIVQIYDQNKLNSPDAIIMQFVMMTVRADAVRMEKGINRKVLSYRDFRGRLASAFEGEFFLEFLLDALLRGDAKKQAETLEIKRRNGVVNANEWRSVDNLNPIGPQGDKYILPGGFGDMETLGAIPASAPAKSGGRSDNSPSNVQFARNAIIDAISKNLKPHRNQVRGYRPKSSSRSREFLKITLEVLEEAVGRIRSVLNTELERLKSKSQDVPESTWEKHRARLVSAILPACKIYCRRSKSLDASAIAERLADVLTANDRSGINQTLTDSLKTATRMYK